MSGHNLSYQLAENYNIETVDPGDAGVLTLGKSGHVYIIETGGSGETRTIATPAKVGLRIGISFKTDGGGDAVITGAGSETFFDGTSAHTTITLSTARDYIELLSTYDGSDIEWVVVSNAGAGLS